MEFQGSPVWPIWVNMRGVPINAWNEEVFRLLGNCLGRTVLGDSKTSRKEDLEGCQVKVLIDRPVSLPAPMFLWVEDIKFPVEISEEEGTQNLRLS